MHARWLPLFAVMGVPSAWAGEVPRPPLDDLAAGMPAEEDTNSWVRMNNGEWLWGEITGYRNDAITIDSDQFGVQVIDMADIAAVWNPRAFEWARRGGEVYKGPGVIADGKAADLLVLGANPAENIRNLRSIEQVWVGGRKIQ